MAPSRPRRGERAQERVCAALFAAGSALAWAWGCGSDRPPPPSTIDGAGGSGGSSSTAGASGVGGAEGAVSPAGGAAMAGGTAGAGGASAGVAPACIARQGCQRLCASLGDDPSGCGVGNAAQCGCICEERFNGPCPGELDALLSCVGDAPSIDCSLRGRVFPGCEDESVALELCDFQAREQLCAQAFPPCTPYCKALTLSFCPQGPESVTSCLCGCEASLATRCGPEFDVFMSCSASALEFTCDADGRAAPAGCGAEWQSLESCVGGVVMPAPDAG